MIYRCDAVLDPPAGPPLVVLSGAGDVIRLECPRHEFGAFELGACYEITVRKVDNSNNPLDRRYP